MDSKVIIIGYTKDPEKIASSSARISTTIGDSVSIFEDATNSVNNQNLVKKVLASGHKTIIEHINFNLAFVNVSAYVEQFMLEFRLASFTVKSRRYVDFSNMGFVVPDFVDKDGNPLKNEKEMRELYCHHMNFLFEEYTNFIKAGIPKEDARFVLPYSYRSNFYCTVNARELCNIIYSMLYGRGKGHAEINSLGNSLLNQAKELCPFIYEDLSVLENGEDKKYQKIISILNEFYDNNNGIQAFSEPSVELLNYTEQPENVVARAALIEYTNLPTAKIEALLKNQIRIEQIIDVILTNRRPRELEQINFTFRINSMTLASLTHLTRHRIQSIIIPPLKNVCKCDRYMIPNTIRLNHGLLQRYEYVYSSTKELYEKFFSYGLNEHEISYLYLSGNVIDITTTMNGRELLAFISLRSCNRTQWETRNIAIEMLNLIRSVSPVLFQRFGPSCYVNGECPEGKMTCGKCHEVQKKFAELMVDPQELPNNSV